MKAYDKVWQDGLKLKLRDLGIQGKLYDVFKANLHEYLRKVQGAPEKDQNYFLVELGLAQGAPESCFFFNVYINGLIEELKKKGIGVAVGDRIVPALLFADDVALLTLQTPRVIEEGFAIIYGAIQGLHDGYASVL